MHLIILMLLLLSCLQGESYSQHEKGVKKYDKSVMKINTLVH